MIKLSILICTIPSRGALLTELSKGLLKQIGDNPEVEVMGRVGLKDSVGKKRQVLLEAANGEYVVFHDDDDPLQSGYVSEILLALQSCPDVVGLRGFMTTNGVKRVPFIIDYGLEYAAVNGEYHRFHNHLCPVKREIALQIGYKDMKYGEDYDYAVRLRDSGLVKMYEFIDKEIYHYDFRTDKYRPR